MFLSGFARRRSNFADDDAALGDCALRLFGRRRAVLISRFALTNSNYFTSARLLFIRTEMKNIRRDVDLAGLEGFTFCNCFNRIQGPFNIRASIMGDRNNIAFMFLNEGRVCPYAVPAITNVTDSSETVNNYFLTSRGTNATFQIFFVVQLNASN